MKNARRIVDSRPGRIVLWIAYVLVSPPLLLMSAVGIFTGAVHALAVGPFDSRFFDSALPLFYGMAGLVGLIAAAARLVFSGELLDRRPLTRKLPILAGLLAGCLVAAIPVAQDLWNGVKAGTWSYAVPLCVGLFLLLSLQGPRE